MRRVREDVVEASRMARPRAIGLDEYVEFLDCNEDLFPEPSPARRLPVDKPFRL